MKASLASWGILLVLLYATVLLNNVAAKKHEGNWDDVQGVAKSCDDCEEEEVTAEDAMTLVKPFLCGKPLVRVRRTGTAASRLASCNTGGRFRCCCGDVCICGDVNVSASKLKRFI